MARVDIPALQKRLAAIAELADVYAKRKTGSTLEEFLAFEREYRETGDLMKLLAVQLDEAGRHRDAEAVREAIRQRPPLMRVH